MVPHYICVMWSLISVCVCYVKPGEPWVMCRWSLNVCVLCEAWSVFMCYVKPNELETIVGERVSALRKLKNNPHDKEALGTIFKVQQQVSVAWWIHAATVACDSLSNKLHDSWSKLVRIWCTSGPERLEYVPLGWGNITSIKNKLWFLHSSLQL